MTDLVAVGLPGSTVAPFADALDLRVQVAEVDDLADTIDDRSTLAVIAGADAGVGVAQTVHATAPDALVVFLAADVGVRDLLGQTLAITPGIGKHSVCLWTGDPELVARVTEALERARLRVDHRQTLSELRTSLGVLGGAAPDSLSRYLGQLFEHAPIGILLAETNGTISAANPGSGNVLGWKPRHAIGVPLPSMFAGHSAELAADLLTDCLTSGDCVSETLPRTGPDGTVQHLEVTMAPVDPKRPDLGVFVLLRDESPRIHALEVSDRARQAAEAAAERYAGLARTLQESLLPPGLPDIEGVELGARYHPAGDGSEIGGDFYDVFEAADGEWFAVMGDVCGKGAGAARLTALTRYTLRAITVRSPSVERNLSDLNAALLRQYDLDRLRNEHRFATAALIRFRREADGVCVSAGSGGHPAPLVLRADGSVEEVACRGPLLGMFEGGTFHVGDVQLTDDDLLLLYTDGVTEARRGTEQFGDDRLRTLLASCAGRSAPEVTAAVEDAVLSFQGGTARDDIALMALRAAPA